MNVRSLAIDISIGVGMVSTLFVFACSSRREVITYEEDVVEAVPSPPATAPSQTKPPAPAECHVAEPTVPTRIGEVLFEDDPEDPLPPVLNGDESGRWVYKNLRLYLPLSAKSQVDAVASEIVGEGMISLTSSQYWQSMKTTIKLKTIERGDVVRSLSFRARGFYEYAGAPEPAIKFQPSCVISDADPPPSSIGFARVSDTSARVHLTMQSPIGKVHLVIDLEKTP
jgi:hypothetical protein